MVWKFNRKRHPIVTSNSFLLEGGQIDSNIQSDISALGFKFIFFLSHIHTFLNRQRYGGEGLLDVGGNPTIAYVADCAGVLRSVCIRRNFRSWSINAYSLDHDPYPKDTRVLAWR